MWLSNLMKNIRKEGEGAEKPDLISHKLDNLSEAIEEVARYSKIIKNAVPLLYEHNLGQHRELEKQGQEIKKLKEKLKKYERKKRK